MKLKVIFSVPLTFQHFNSLVNVRSIYISDDQFSSVKNGFWLNSNHELTDILDDDVVCWIPPSQIQIIYVVKK